MSEEDDNMHNNEEYVENYEENENMEGMNQEEYDEENMNENGEEEEGQDVYAFDIQINDDSYLLVIGKTDENKLLSSPPSYFLDTFKAIAVQPMGGIKYF